MRATQIGGSIFFQQIHNSMSVAFFPVSVTEEEKKYGYFMQDGAITHS
jgi:hypothetical protein